MFSSWEFNGSVTDSSNPVPVPNHWGEFKSFLFLRQNVRFDVYTLSLALTLYTGLVIDHLIYPSFSRFPLPTCYFDLNWKKKKNHQKNSNFMRLICVCFNASVRNRFARFLAHRARFNLLMTSPAVPVHVVLIVSSSRTEIFIFTLKKRQQYFGCFVMAINFMKSVQADLFLSGYSYKNWKLLIMKWKIRSEVIKWFPFWKMRILKSMFPFSVTNINCRRFSRYVMSQEMET